MTFDQMIKRMSKTQVHISDDETFVYSESFMGRDKNDQTMLVSRDGDSTCYVSLPDSEYRHGVPIAYVGALMGEYGFDVKHSRWDTEESMRIQAGDEEGYVYIMQMADTNLFKIGRTKHYRSRVKLLGVLMPKPCEFVGVWQTKHMRTLEMVLHRDYAIHHSNGEWFALPNVGRTVEFLDVSQKRVV
jgi:hypothetical protein